jgi:tetratricopeptide (TPR) repeat protein
VEFAERAVQMSAGQQPRILATLAASYAEAGQYPKALETAQRALGLAAKLNDRQLAEGLNAMIALYEVQKPFRDVKR